MMMADEAEFGSFSYIEGVGDEVVCVVVAVTIVMVPLLGYLVKRYMTLVCTAVSVVISNVLYYVFYHCLKSLSVLTIANIVMVMFLTT